MPREEWINIDVLMGMALPERVRYVRENLEMSQPAFAKAVGASSREIVSRWERLDRPSRPRNYAAKIAGLTPSYPPQAFGAEGEAELVRTSLGTRLRALEVRFETFVEAASERQADREVGRGPSTRRSTRRSHPTDEDST